MKGSSIKIGRISGIPIYLHFSFLLILPFLAWSFGRNLQTLAAFADVPPGALGGSPFVWGLMMAVALFASVLLHEFGHALAARRQQIHTHGITLMLFGGVAQLEDMPKQPGAEARIAFAGPVASFATGAILYMVVSALGPETDPRLAFSLAHIGYLNIFLGVFNLLPAFPMDGGRVLRSLLVSRRSFVSATRIAVDVGKACAFAFGIIGLVGGNLFLVLIALFVYMGATQELHHAVYRTTLDGFRVRDLMSTDVVTVEASSNVQSLVERMLVERHMGYPVVQDGRVAGCVTLEDIDKVDDSERETAKIGDIMSTPLHFVGPDDDIYVALKEMGTHEIGRLAVLDGEQLVGIVSRSDIMRGFHLRRLQPAA